MYRAIPWLVLLFVTLMAGGTYVMIRYMVGLVSPVVLFGLRFVPAAAFSLILLLIFYRKTALKIFLRDWKYFLIREFVAVVGFHLTLIYATSVLPAGIAAIIVAIWPIIVIFIAALVLGEAVTAKKVVGACLAFLGAALVIILRAQAEAEMAGITIHDWIKFSLILLIAPFCAATVTVITRLYLNRGEGNDRPDVFIFSLICRVPSALYVMIALALFPNGDSLVTSLSGLPLLFWLFVFILSIYNSVIGFWMWNWVIQRLQAASVASFSYIQTGITLVIAWIFLGEPLGFVKILGAVMIIAGVIYANVEHLPKKPGDRPPAAVKLPVSPGST